MRYDSGAHNENLSSSASSFQLSPPLNACLTPVCRPRSVAQRFRVMIGRAHSEFFPGAITFRLVRTDSFFSLDYNTRQQIPRRRSPTDDQIYPLDDKPSQKSEQSQKRRMLLSRFVPFSLRGSFCLYSSECTSWTMEILNSSGVCNVFILKLIPLSMLSDDADFKSKNV